MKNPNENYQMTGLLTTMFTDMERATVARSVVDTQWDAVENDQLCGQAREALVAYNRKRVHLLENISEHMEGDMQELLDASRQESMFRTLYKDMIEKELYWMDGITNSERCDRIYRFIQGMDCALKGEMMEDSEPYTGPVDKEAEEQLVEDLCARMAVANASMADVKKLTKGLVKKGTALVAADKTEAMKEKLVHEAVALYQLAHEGKLSRFSQEITLTECVNFVAVSQDVDHLRRAEMAGEITSNVTAFLAIALLFVAALALMFSGLALLAWLGGINIVLDILLLVVAAGTYLSGLMVTMEMLVADEYQRSDLTDTLMDAAQKYGGKFGSYLAVMLPAKLRGLFKHCPVPDDGDDGDDPAVMLEAEVEKKAKATVNQQAFA